MRQKKKQKLSNIQPRSGSLSQADFVSKLIALHSLKTIYSTNKFTGTVGDIFQDTEHSDVFVKLVDLVIDSDETVFVKLECITCAEYRFISEIFPNFSFKNIELEKEKNSSLKESLLSNHGRLRKDTIAFIPANYLDMYFRKVFPDKWDELEKILHEGCDE